MKSIQIPNANLDIVTLCTLPGGFSTISFLCLFVSNLGKFVICYGWNHWELWDFERILSKLCHDMADVIHTWDI